VIQVIVNKQCGSIALHVGNSCEWSGVVIMNMKLSRASRIPQVTNVNSLG
jgi:hypothetical protein